MTTTAYKNKIYTGKTITWNQLIQNGDFININDWVVEQGTYRIADNEIAMVSTGKYTYMAIRQIIPTSLMVSGHKYLIDFDVPYITGGYHFVVGLHNGKMQQQPLERNPSTGEAFHVSAFWSPNDNYINTMGQTNRLMIYAANNLQLGDNSYVMKLMNVQMFDLTLMFGAGNEPATAEEFWSHFERKVYPYNTGESQPLYLISRKRKIKSGNAMTTSYKTKIKEG